ncbi:uncharacterized protein DS421_2g58180 [Arachis hypogaea]|nr:uncharacterized protein DS421_2g58180 [Arachis hypogaea]
MAKKGKGSSRTVEDEAVVVPSLARSTQQHTPTHKVGPPTFHVDPHPHARGPRHFQSPNLTCARALPLRAPTSPFPSLPSFLPSMAKQETVIHKACLNALNSTST